MDTKNNALSTPAAAWRQAGDPDPHAGHYDCERAKLVMGHLTDDELANGAFLNYDQPLNVQGILAGTHSSPIAWMTAVKDRIRWLSRALEQAKAERDALFSKLSQTTFASRDVLAERRRQIEAEGWTPEHDDVHKEGSLGRAGGFYALNAGAALWYGTHDTSICDTAPDGWPWAPEWWKPANARRDLVKAGALILAEIERIDRASARKINDLTPGDEK